MFKTQFFEISLKVPLTFVTSAVVMPSMNVNKSFGETNCSPLNACSAKSSAEFSLCSCCMAILAFSCCLKKTINEPQLLYNGTIYKTNINNFCANTNERKQHF